MSADAEQEPRRRASRLVVLLPLAVFGPSGYGRRQGLIVAPARFLAALAYTTVLAVRWNETPT